jgi:hypothetical protein
MAVSVKGVQLVTTRFLTRTAVLLAIVLAIQLLRLPQPVTGPLVNAILLLAGALVGMGSGVMIGMLTPFVAFLVGILPPVLGPAIPAIIAGNTVLVVVFSLFHKLVAGRSGPYLGIIVGAGLKYLVMAGAVKYLLALPPGAATALQIPQLLTALAGGILALIGIRVLHLITEKERTGVNGKEVKEQRKLPVLFETRSAYDDSDRSRENPGSKADLWRRQT